MSKYTLMKLYAVVFLSICSILLAETGMASWYGPNFQGKPTANGETFDTNKLTAAHKTLPFGTIVKVTNLSNGKSVNVRINDRGPFVKGRIIDLSRAAARDIDMLTQGVARVRLEIVDGNSAQALKPPVNRTEAKDQLLGISVPDGVASSITIQVSSFSKSGNAHALRRKLSKEGFDTALEFPSTGHTRVIIHSVDRKDLPQVLDKLKALGYEDVLVRDR